jgi:hypothetical protein
LRIHAVADPLHGSAEELSTTLWNPWDALYAIVSQIGSMLERGVFGFNVHVIEVSRPTTGLIFRSKICLHILGRFQSRLCLSDSACL